MINFLHNEWGVTKTSKNILSVFQNTKTIFWGILYWITQDNFQMHFYVVLEISSSAFHYILKILPNILKM